MALCKTAVTPLIVHWSDCSLLKNIRLTKYYLVVTEFNINYVQNVNKVTDFQLFIEELFADTTMTTHRKTILPVRHWLKKSSALVFIIWVEDIRSLPINSLCQIG